MEIDPLPLVNLILCLAIVALGLLGYKRSRHTLPLLLAVVFALFGLSHAIVLLGSFEDLEPVVFAVRVVAYGLVLYLLYRYVRVLDIF
ncbi:MAG TPA: hypothetical protein P5063_08165, partial [Methanomassiliicoccales archaeon]|nr:hypothetical protein [Methanomassiliicoccales archaeon]